MHRNDAIVTEAFISNMTQYLRKQMVHKNVRWQQKWEDIYFLTVYNLKILPICSTFQNQWKQRPIIEVICTSIKQLDISSSSQLECAYLEV